MLTNQLVQSAVSYVFLVLQDKLFNQAFSLVYLKVSG